MIAAVNRNLGFHDKPQMVNTSERTAILFAVLHRFPLILPPLDIAKKTTPQLCAGTMDSNLQRKSPVQLWVNIPYKILSYAGPPPADEDVVVVEIRRVPGAVALTQAWIW